MTTPNQAVFTGRHMLLIMLAFFGVVIGVNITMAVFARSSWTGFVVANSYVASQEFNEKMALTRAQAALDWHGTFSMADGRVRYAIRDASNASVRLAAATATFRRPVDDREDHTVVLARDADGGCSLVHPLADGVWLVEISADAGLDQAFRETLRVHVSQGRLK